MFQKRITITEEGERNFQMADKCHNLISCKETIVMWQVNAEPLLTKSVMPIFDWQTQYPSYFINSEDMRVII